MRRSEFRVIQDGQESAHSDCQNPEGEATWPSGRTLRFCQRETPMELRPPPLSPAKRGGRVIGYARVSTTDQRLDMQLDALTRARCSKVFFDHGVSGAKAARPGLDQGLAYVHPGDTFVVYKLDRLGRSVLHLADLLTRLDRDGVHFCSLTEAINTATPSGKLVFHIFAATAEFHRDLIRENTRNGLLAARKRGAQIGRPAKLSLDQLLEADRLMQQEGWDMGRVMRRFKVSESTILRGLKRLAEV